MRWVTGVISPANIQKDFNIWAESKFQVAHFVLTACVCSTRKDVKIYLQMCLCFYVETSSWWSWVCFFCNSGTRTAAAILTIDRPPISHFHRQVGWTWRQREEETWGRCRPWRLPPAARRLRHSDVRAGEEKGGLLRRDESCLLSERFGNTRFLRVEPLTRRWFSLVMIKHRWLSLSRFDGLTSKSRRTQIESVLSASWWVRRTGPE